VRGRAIFVKAKDHEELELDLVYEARRKPAEALRRLRVFVIRFSWQRSSIEGTEDDLTLCLCVSVLR
jgi:hypothetical protein